MKKLLTTVVIAVSNFVFSQFSTGSVSLGTSGMTLKMDVNPTKIILNLSGPENNFMALAFGTTDILDPAEAFIYSTGAPERGYYLPGNISPPYPIAVQYWTEISNVTQGGIRTIVYSRPLSTGDPRNYVFVNAEGPFNLVYATGRARVFGTMAPGIDYGAQLLRFASNLATSETLKHNKQKFVSQNPANQSLHLSNPDDINSVQLIDLSGKLLLNKKINSSDLDISNIKPGVYQILINTKDGSTFSEKIIIN